MPNLKRLREEHDDLAAIGARLAEIVSKPTPPDAAELYGIRMELASALILHLKSEDWILYPTLIASEDAATAQTARKFSDEMGGLSKAFGAYAERWVANAIQADWTGYQRETTNILRALTHRMMRENRELYPLLDAARRLTA